MLKAGITYSKGFVDNQDIRPFSCSHTEGQSHLHTTRIDAHGLIDVFTDFGEGFDLRHQGSDFFYTQPDELPGHKGILPPGEIGVEAHAEFKQRSRINDRARAADRDPGFSIRIREGLPDRPATDGPR